MYDPKGNFRIGIDGDQIVAVIHGKAVQGKHWQDVLYTILSTRKFRCLIMPRIWGESYTKQSWQSGSAEVLNRTGSSEWFKSLEKKGNF